MRRFVASIGAGISAGWVTYAVLDGTFSTWSLALHAGFLVFFLSALMGRE